MTQSILWLWYTPFGLGGVETFLLNLSRCAVEDGWGVSIAGIQNADGPLRSEHGTAVEVLDWSSFSPAYMGKVDPKEALARIAADLDRIRPSVVAINDCSDFAIGAADLLRIIRPYCTIIDTFHIDPLDNHYFELRNTYTDVLDGVAGTSERALQRWRACARSERLPATKYIRNGVSMPMLPRRPFDGVFRLLSVGRVAQKQKRILELPGVFRSLREAGIRFAATIVGEGEERAALEAALAERSLLDVVRLTGFIPPAEVLPLYYEHDFLLNVSSYEGFSMSVIEALASGCIPLCTDLPNLDHDIFLDGVNSLLIGVDDLGAITHRLSSLTPQDIETMSQQAASTGRELTAAKTWQGYRDFIAGLQAQRPLRAWPADVHSLLDVPWDPTRDNPWLPHPHPLRRLLNRMLEAAGARKRD
ncbi:MAG TPA: glycosyltransferase family 4 protein [Thermoanaerobaculia bacterium]|nr:glycosyltransferase family 4 protein [Thermoanaerobaculia bacterium]